MTTRQVPATVFADAEDEDEDEDDDDDEVSDVAPTAEQLAER